jgi:hypothetical protein
MAGMAALSRRLVHNLNELRRLQNDHFVRLGQGEARTVQVCGTELDLLALHYRRYVGSWRVGPEAGTCQEVVRHFSRIAEAMEHLQGCLKEAPDWMRQVYQTYQDGHAAWSLEGDRRTSDANHLIAQLWREGHAAAWFLPDRAGAEVETQTLRGEARNRAEELERLAGLMRRLAGIYQALQGPSTQEEGGGRGGFDEKDALVANLADLIRKKARPVLHTVDIATAIHAWATGDVNPSPGRFQAAYQTWKNRPEPKRRG